MNSDDDLPITMEDEPVITFDEVIGWIRNALAGVGIVACIAAIGFWSVK